MLQRYIGTCPRVRIQAKEQGGLGEKEVASRYRAAGGRAGMAVIVAKPGSAKSSSGV
jgi:hypothetical protein